METLFLSVTNENLPYQVQAVVRKIVENSKMDRVKALFTYPVLGLEYGPDMSLVSGNEKIDKLYLERARALVGLRDGFRDCVNILLQEDSSTHIEIEDSSGTIFHSGYYASHLVTFELRRGKTK